MADVSDNQLLELIQKGETRDYGFNLLVQKYSKQVYLTIRRMVIIHEDADDLVQEVFIKVWKNIGKFRADSQLFTWIYRIAVNESINFLKNKKLQYIFALQSYNRKLSDSLADDNYFTGDEAWKKLQKALLTLPEKQRIVFNLRYFDELSYHQIAEITGTSEGALKASFHLAVKKIENFIKAN